MSLSRLPARKYLNNKEQGVVQEALSFHPKAAKKIGCGVNRMFVQRSITDQGAEICCFYVEREDGSEEDFSLLKIYKKSYGSGFDAGTGALRGADQPHRSKKG